MAALCLFRGMRADVINDNFGDRYAVEPNAPIIREPGTDYVKTDRNRISYIKKCDLWSRLEGERG